jgi:hypothetical protein
MATQWNYDFSPGEVLTAGVMDSLGAVWETYTPTLVQSTAVTKTVTIARYGQIQKIVFGTVFLVVTGTGVATNQVKIGLPIAAKVGSNSAIIGGGFVYDASANAAYNMAAVQTNVNEMAFLYETGSEWGISPNIALAASDQLRFDFFYEVP